MLTEKLNTIEALKPLPGRGTPPATRRLIHKHNSELYCAALSTYFDGRPCHCYMTPTDFWVYATSLADACEIKLQAQKYGYKNIRTIKVNYSDGEPFITEFAVVVSATSDLIIGEIALKFFDILKPVLDDFKISLLFKHGHYRRYSLTLSSMEAAKALQKRIETILKGKDGDSRIQASVNIKKLEIDAINVHVNFV
ncbi:MAG: hypothetical protein CL578_05850 [Alteromonadaceae bacterium]|uniref:hypothetical protein n=1 Tax=uncultured Paraglaciecola sp. TaxID=1765024 RepID=UPI000C5475E2|nr:hypothetical protein [Alteromonadaceae bacterium]|tara:strand:- start:13250 stop:13837 length:588 start_codon:yes stop_codon:yes gene_type:complete